MRTQITVNNPMYQDVIYFEGSKEDFMWIFDNHVPAAGYVTFEGYKYKNEPKTFIINPSNCSTIEIEEVSHDQ